MYQLYHSTFFSKSLFTLRFFLIQLLNEKRKQTKVEEKSPKNEEDKKLPTKSKVRKNLRKAQKTLTSSIWFCQVNCIMTDYIKDQHAMKLQYHIQIDVMEEIAVSCC